VRLEKCILALFVEKMYVQDALIAKEAYVFNVQLPDVPELT
jgi:hypothetical protein